MLALERRLRLVKFSGAAIVVLTVVLALFRWFAVTETPIPGTALSPAA